MQRQVTAMWHTEARWRSRLLVEQELMRARFPHFVLMLGRSRELFWNGTVEPVVGARFVLRVVYPATYPYASPTLHVDALPFHLGVPHLYADHSLCVHRRQWDPTRGTAAGMVPLACVWLFLFQRWRDHGEAF